MLTQKVDGRNVRRIHFRDVDRASDSTWNVFEMLSVESFHLLGIMFLNQNWLRFNRVPRKES